MDIYHTGKEDASDDHKFINERLLEVALPPEPTDGSTLTLEDCLEAYFNNRIEVKRHLERRNTVSSTRSVDSMSISKGFTAHIEEIETTPTLSPVQSNSPQVERPSPWTSVSDTSETMPRRGITRRSSIVQERFIPDPTDGTANNQPSSGSDPQQRRGIFRKEVMMPAWQFFSLIRTFSHSSPEVASTDVYVRTAWYTENSPTNDAQVAAHFASKRPILGMCLKRYSFTPNGNATRRDTYIDIPTEIGLPHFIQDDNMDADAPIYGNFKLSLQAMVCHRGNSVDSGHYISIVRGTSANLTPSTSSGSSDTLETPKHWMRFDDLAAERVTLIDIETALRTESPYLLFYQILPINQDASLANLPNKAPSSRASDATLDVDMADIAQKYRYVSGNETDGSVTEVNSARPSFEITAPDSPSAQALNSTGRRPSSVIFSETAPTGPQARSIPSMSPKLAPMEEEEVPKNSFSFRRGSRNSKSNPGSRTGSRAASQTGDNKIGTTFSRFTGRLSKDRFTSDGEGEGDESANEVDETIPDEMKLGPAAYDSKEKAGRGRTKDRATRDKTKDKSKEKLKEKAKEKTRKPERECVVM